jgi:hypothetical protein
MCCYRNMVDGLSFGGLNARLADVMMHRVQRASQWAGAGNAIIAVGIGTTGFVKEGCNVAHMA